MLTKDSPCCQGARTPGRGKESVSPDQYLALTKRGDYYIYEYKYDMQPEKLRIIKFTGRG